MIDSGASSITISEAVRELGFQYAGMRLGRLRFVRVLSYEGDPESLFTQAKRIAHVIVSVARHSPCVREFLDATSPIGLTIE